jgi:hypothetical protein
MTPEYRAISNLFQTDHRKFKTIISESIKDRISVLLENSYKNISKNILKEQVSLGISSVEPQIQINKTPVDEFEIPRGTFILKDGTSIRLDDTDQYNLTKLYENLNTNGKDRFKRIIFETKSGFDRLLNLAKIERKK